MIAEDTPACLPLKMGSCLYECLCEAELDKYYPNFIALGFQKIDELATVSMKDYAKLGVQNMKDRKHLFQLIKIIKILQAEEEAVEKNKQRFQTGTVCLQPQVARRGPRRQLHFDFISDKRDDEEEEDDSDTGLCRLSSTFVKKDKDDLATVLGHDSDHKRPQKDIMNLPAAWTECKLDFPSMSLANGIAPLLGDTEAPVVQRVAHISGYNYGVPHSYVRPNTSEKEMPWTETDKIRVCVRKRPLGLREERRGEVNVITVEDKETLLLHEKKEAVDLTQYILQHVFYFDEVFGEACSNQDVYMKTAHPLIQHIFNGGNATCFAYGQTGAGKTYTMIGTYQNPGLYALAAKDIFRHLETSQAGKDLHVWISFYEIYCGQLYDLLNGRKRLFAREDSKHVVQIVGLREVHVDTVNLLLEVILKGGKERSTGATGVNSDSSRSHAIIQIQIKDAAKQGFGRRYQQGCSYPNVTRPECRIVLPSCLSKDDSPELLHTMGQQLGLDLEEGSSRISFIDLAGSERAADARDSDRQTKMEGAEINQSLLALKECIRALDQEHAHTPFRQSKLTQVLKDSFIGNSKTCMIANVSPSHVATEHTLNTLRYADRVKELKKGIRCCLPVANRRRTTGSLSPKRFQSSLTVQAGERSSPKKVKLGLQSPSRTAARTKASPLLFHPASSPYSSTPKGAARKGRCVAAWLGHPSPPKGALGAGPSAKKTIEDFAPLPENSPLGQDRGCRAAPAPKAMKEGGQGERQRVRSRKVQLVRKQLVPRADFSLGEARSPSARVPNGGRGFAEQCTEAWTSLPSQQKDRERHLRFYHQQFQQPPILQEKLNYQPLERFLAQYKPLEVQVRPETPGRPPSPLQGPDETMQLEDLDDSDFSEDSFSPGPSQRKPEAEGGREGSQHSFFLHRRDCEADGREVQLGQELFFELSDLESKEGASPRTEEAAGSEQSAQSQSDWSTEEASMLDSPPQNDTAEKPYCLQGDSVEGSSSSVEDPLAGRNLPRRVHRDLGSPEESFSGSEKATQIWPFAHALGAASCLAPGRREDSAKGCSADLEKQLPKASDLSGSLAFSLDFVAGPGAPLMAPLLDAERANAVEKDALDQQPGKTRLEEEREGKDPLSPRTQVDEKARLFLGKKAASLAPLHKMDPRGRRVVQPLSPQGKPQWLPRPHRRPKPPASLGDVSPVGELPGCSCSFSAGSTGLAEILSPWKGKDGPLLLGGRQAGEVSADAEAVAIALSSSPEQFHLGEKGCSESVMPPKRPDLPEKAFVSRASENQGPSGQSLPLQPSLEVQKPELGCSQQQFKLTFHSEETRLLKKQSASQAFLQKSSDAAKQDSGSNVGSPRSSPDDDSKSSLGSQEVLGRQAVIQIRQEQLDEMAALSLQEDGLIRQMSDLDLENFVMKLDGLFLLKLKCIQRMRTQLQPLLATEQRMSPN